MVGLVIILAAILLLGAAVSLMDTVHICPHCERELDPMNEKLPRDFCQWCGWRRA